jgi:hypothetical protein
MAQVFWFFFSKKNIFLGDVSDRTCADPLALLKMEGPIDTICAADAWPAAAYRRAG